MLSENQPESTFNRLFKTQVPAVLFLLAIVAIIFAVALFIEEYDNGQKHIELIILMANRLEKIETDPAYKIAWNFTKTKFIEIWDGKVRLHD